MKVIKKFLSRKFILTALTFLCSLLYALVGIGGEAGTVCSVISAFLSPIVYVLVEGKIDEKALKMISEATELAAAVNETEKN